MEKTLRRSPKHKKKLRGKLTARCHAISPVEAFRATTWQNRKRFVISIVHPSPRHLQAVFGGMQTNKESIWHNLFSSSSGADSPSSATESWGPTVEVRSSWVAYFERHSMWWSIHSLLELRFQIREAKEDHRGTVLQAIDRILKASQGVARCSFANLGKNLPIAGVRGSNSVFLLVLKRM